MRIEEDGLRSMMRLAISNNMPCCAAAKPFPPWPQSSVEACMHSNGFTSEHHDLPHCLAFMQAVEAQIDLIEP